MRFDAFCVSTLRPPAITKRIECILFRMNSVFALRIEMPYASSAPAIFRFMKAFPIPNGAIRIEVEDADDWRLLTHLLVDAGDPTYDPAADASGRMMDDEVAEDWREYVVPDLKDQFDATLNHVSNIIEAACRGHEGGKGGVTITLDHCHDWYGVLNRARLALEAKHRLAVHKNNPSAEPEIRAARLRDRLYCALQSLILDHAFD